MERTKLLFITCDFQHYTERNTFYLTEELAKNFSLALWHWPGRINDILQQIPFKPDFILLNDMKETRCPDITGLAELIIPWGIIVHDLHYEVAERRKLMKQNRVRNIFSIYRDAFRQRFPEFASRMRWLPHFVNTELFKDYQLTKDHNWLMMGKIASYYPLRQKMYRTMKGKNGFVYYPHPGYRQISDDKEKGILVGERYAREIGRAKMFLTCDSIFHYPLIKYYEVLACKTLLLAPASRELRDLGFVPGIHFVAIDQSNFKRKAYYYLQHVKERQRIAEAGYRMVHNKHSAIIRANQLCKMIGDIIAEEQVK
ncbi:MAG: glycosyltransferase [Methanomassiliicoccales archaeon]